MCFKGMKKNPEWKNIFEGFIYIQEINDYRILDFSWEM